jgi:hypothetical protein
MRVIRMAAKMQKVATATQKPWIPALRWAALWAPVPWNAT